MADCPFLTTNDVQVKCFEACALYNYKGNHGKCPFLSVYSYKNSVNVDILDYYNLENDIAYIRELYKDVRSQYL